MISVVIPLYNKRGLVSQTIATVLAQTYNDYEIVVVDDGSTDGSIDEVKAIADQRIRIVSRQNGGVAAARNTGIQHARGEFVAFLDADDRWAPQYLETQAALAQKYPSCDVFGTLYDTLSPRGDKMPVSPRKIAINGENGILDNYFVVASSGRPPLWTSAAMVRRSAITAIGGFPCGVRSGEDLLTWARLAARHSIAYSLRPLATYCLGFSNPRPPEPSDFVGAQLEILARDNSTIPGIRRNVAEWYKMRMCRCIAHRMLRLAAMAYFKSITFNPFQLKIYHAIYHFSRVKLPAR